MNCLLINSNPVTSGRLILDMIKESMENDRARDNYVIEMLKEQITFFKGEITHKNYIIKQLVDCRKNTHEDVPLDAADDELNSYDHTNSRLRPTDSSHQMNNSSFDISKIDTRNVTFRVKKDNQTTNKENKENKEQKSLALVEIIRDSMLTK